MGRRGPPKKPNGVRLTGRRGSLPQELEVTPARPACPAWLALEAKREWRRVVPLLDGLGLLATVDRAALANYCASWAEWVEYQEGVTKYGAVLPVTKDGATTLTVSPYVRLASEARDRMMRAAGQFGFSPASRVGLKAAKPVTPVVRARPTPQTIEDTRSVLRVLEGGGA